MNLLKKNKQDLIISKLNLNYYYKQYMYYIIDNMYILNLKHFEIKLNNLYKVIKNLLLDGGKIGYLAYSSVFKKDFYKSLKISKKYSLFTNYKFSYTYNKNLKNIIRIYTLWRGGSFTSNVHLKKKELCDFFIIGDVAANNHYILNEINILKRPVISFIRFDLKDNTRILYKLFGNHANLNVLYFYNKLLNYYIYKSMIYKKINFYFYFI